MSAAENLSFRGRGGCQRGLGRTTSRSSTVLRPSWAATRMASSHSARTCSDSMSATPSLQFMPLRSRMYFFILDTTMSTSRSKLADNTGWLLPAGAVVPVPVDVETTWRRASCDGAEVAIVGAAVGPEPVLGAAARTGAPVGESGVAIGVAAASSACQAASVGDVASTAHASRCRSTATWLSQHDTEQNTNRVRLRLHVDTEHTQCMAEKPMPRLHALHLSHSFMAAMLARQSQNCLALGR